MSRAALGRGLDALIPASSEAQRARELPLDAIEPNPQQPRKSFAPDQSAELAESIREHGILQPLLVRQLSGGRYQLVAGERRWRAAELAGLERVPVVVVDVPDRDMLTLALVENLQREDLNPIDQAVAFQYLIDAGLTQAQVAERIGKSRSSVANSVRLLQLPEDLRAEVTAGRLGEGHARALLGAPPELRLQLAGDAIAQQLTVREIEEAVRRLQASIRLSDTPEPDDEAESAPPPDTEAWDRWREDAAEQLQRAFGTRVSVSHESSTGGRISLRWYSFEQLEYLVKRLAAASTQDADGASGGTGRITV